MSIQAKREYIAMPWALCRQATARAEKSRILNEISRNLGMHRKSAIRLLSHEEYSGLKRAAA